MLVSTVMLDFGRPTPREKSDAFNLSLSTTHLSPNVDGSSQVKVTRPSILILSRFHPIPLSLIPTLSSLEMLLCSIGSSGRGGRRTPLEAAQRRGWTQNHLRQPRFRSPTPPTSSSVLLPRSTRVSLWPGPAGGGGAGHKLHMGQQRSLVVELHRPRALPLGWNGHGEGEPCRRWICSCRA